MPAISASIVLFSISGAPAEVDKGVEVVFNQRLFRIRVRYELPAGAAMLLSRGAASSLEDVEGNTAKSARPERVLPSGSCFLCFLLADLPSSLESLLGIVSTDVDRFSVLT